MSIESQHWLNYARENLAVCRMCLSSGLWNPCLENAQQTVEKSLKGLRSRRGLGEKRIHDIRSSGGNWQHRGCPWNSVKMKRN